jgi:hypothetical protein
MEMVGKQSSPFMELFGQLCLTAWATVSYCLWKWLASSSHRLWNYSSKQSSPLATNVLRELFSVLLELLRVGKQFSSFVELLQQEVQELRSQLETKL